MYDYRGLDGTGTASKPASGSNAVSYTVRKLADGNCWMSENLKLTLVQNRTYEVGTFDGGTYNWSGVNTGSTNSYNTVLNGNTVCTGSGSSTKCWYNWYAATAGQGVESKVSNITRSICPKGWKLPNGGSDAAPSFANLITTTYSIGNNSAGSTKLQGFPLSFYYAGYYLSGSLYGTSSGSYWSASPDAGGVVDAYFLYFGSSAVRPQSFYTKFSGFSVRCVAIP